MASWNEGEEGDNWVTYGTAFSDDETGMFSALFLLINEIVFTEEGRFRAMQSGKQRAVPAAYEQRILNEKGRPLRFHGAFTGGFSAGYFNTVGSKEGEWFDAHCRFPVLTIEKTNQGCQHRLFTSTSF
ncbi:hypothetical protein EG68_10657 [Paragonimus skrjabini miyazakii]|uniref:G patch domain-containing protein n=1 Tax=Paragonimus skrjabini miyazakii TaxID=59628 RepID=A0A8S9YIR8_9TREM|nr:hypothetical protein EG68_10657 [Paragonimus skrjabini miyazakii]